jgi:Ca-activated chloride channel family protein
VSSVIALDAQARVVFNPEAIKAYRLVGHGPSSITGLGDDVWASELRSGQEATLLFEVWTHDSYEDELASATVQWISPETVAPKESRRASLGRYDVATRLSESAPSLRSAAIAAEIGARLQGIGSFELRSDQEFRSRKKPASWQEVIISASELTAEIGVSEDFLRLLELARNLEALRSPSEPSKTL